MPVLFMIEEYLFKILLLLIILLIINLVYLLINKSSRRMSIYFSPISDLIAPPHSCPITPMVKIAGTQEWSPPEFSVCFSVWSFTLGYLYS